MNDTDRIKECKACGEIKNQSDFYFRNDRNTYSGVCKRCSILGKRIVKVDTGLKTCKHCNEKKPYSEYQKAGGGKWLQPYCKPCDKTRKDEHRQKNKISYNERELRNYHKNKKLLTKEELRISRVKAIENY